MTSRVVHRPAARRLLVIGGFLAAGWLLGSAGQAHADTGPEPGITAAVVGTMPDRPVPDRDASAVLPGKAAARGTFSGVVHRAVVPVREVTPVRDSLPSKIEHVVTNDAGMDAPWSPRRPQTRTDADTGSGTRMAANDVAYRSASGATEDVRDDQVQSRTGAADPAPQPGFPCRTALQTGALPCAGSTPTGGAVGHPARLGAAARPATVLRTSVLDVIPPAVHAATDEPALSPD